MKSILRKIWAENFLFLSKNGFSKTKPCRKKSRIVFLRTKIGHFSKTEQFLAKFRSKFGQKCYENQFWLVFLLKISSFRIFEPKNTVNFVKKVPSKKGAVQPLSILTWTENCAFCIFFQNLNLIYFATTDNEKIVFVGLTASETKNKQRKIGAKCHSISISLYN